MASLPLTARKHGSFKVSLLGGFHRNEKKLYPKQERVIRGLLAKAIECRYFSHWGPRKEPFKSLLEKIAKYRGGSWEFDLSKELVKGYEPIWNDRGSGFVIVTEAPARELAPTFAECERGESWPAGSRPWWKFVGQKKVGVYCKKIVRKRDAAVFLIYGYVHAFDLEVFARGKRLAQLWNVSRGKGKPPAFVEEAPNLHVRFGKPKNMHKVTLRECLRYPIWVFTGEEEEEYDEEYETPVISTKNVSASLLENYEPHITVRVKDANLYGSGYYDHGQRELNNICVWQRNRWVRLEEAKLNGSLTFVAVPSILGKKNVAFRCDDPGSDAAERLG